MRHLLIALACLAAAAAAPAQGRTVSDALGAAITLERYHSGFAIGQATYDADVNEIGLTLRQHFGDNFSLGMEAGYADMSLANDPAVQNLSPAGYFGNLTLRYLLPFGKRFGLDFTAGGGYRRLTDSKGADSVVERWWSYSAAVGPRFSLDYFGVEAGLVYRHASGTEASSGAPGTRSLAFEHTTNPYVDLTFEVTQGGTFAIHAEGGARRSIGLVFGYLFTAP